MNIKTLIFSILMIWSNAWAQISLQCIPMVGNRPIELGQNYTIGNEVYTFQTLKFYLSHLTFHSQQKLLLNSNPVTLVNLEEPSSQYIGTIDSSIVRLDFLFGTDSLTNVSGNLEGALDPINGMYWAWNSGYINLKTEGIYQDSSGRVTPFEFHIGGYLSPSQTVRKLSFDVNGFKGTPQLMLQMDEWLLYAFEKGIFSVMVPGKFSSELATEIQDSFYLTYRREP